MAKNIPIDNMLQPNIGMKTVLNTLNNSQPQITTITTIATTARINIMQIRPIINAIVPAKNIFINRSIGIIPARVANEYIQNLDNGIASSFRSGSLG